MRHAFGARSPKLQSASPPRLPRAMTRPERSSPTSRRSASPRRNSSPDVRQPVEPALARTRRGRERASAPPLRDRATTRRRLQPGQTRVDALEGGADAVAAWRAGGLEVAALQHVEEDVGNLRGGAAAFGLVPLVEPVAHAEDAEDHEGRGQVAKEPFVDAVAVGALDGAIVLAAGAGRARGHGSGQPGLLGEEDFEERQMAGQQRDLVAHDAAELLVGGKALLDDLGEPGPEGLDGPLEDQAQELVLAPHVSIEGDLGEPRLGRDGVEGGRTIAHLSETGGGDPKDLAQGRGPRSLHTPSSPT